jgi:hypothetical protein
MRGRTLEPYLGTMGFCCISPRVPANRGQGAFPGSMTGKLLEIALLSQALRDLNMKLRRQASLAILMSSIVSMLQTCDWFRSL